MGWLVIVFRALARAGGEKLLALPALGRLFARRSVLI
jgi:hypothetical protein